MRGRGEERDDGINTTTTRALLVVTCILMLIFGVRQLATTQWGWLFIIGAGVLSVIVAKASRKPE